MIDTLSHSYSNLNESRGDFLLNPSFSMIYLPSNREAKRHIANPFGPFIHSWYRQDEFSHEIWRKMRREERNRLIPRYKQHMAIEGILEGKQLMVAYDHDEPIGLLAYTILSRSNDTTYDHPLFYYADLALKNEHRRRGRVLREARKVNNIVHSIKSIFLTNEMVVNPKARGNHIAERMREVALQQIPRGTSTAVIGEIQTLASLKQRELLSNDYDGISWWAGNIVYNRTSKLHWNSPQFPEAAEIFAKAYIQTFHPNTYETYQDGIFSSELFTQYAQLPSRGLKEQPKAVQNAFTALVKQQQEDLIARKSAIAVTFIER